MGGSLDGLDADLRQGLQELLQLLGQNRIVGTVTSTVRSFHDQKFLYDRYTKDPAHNLPAAPPGHSAHEYGWAFDMIVSPDNYQHGVGKVWEHDWGGKWGGAKDPVHFELPGASQLAWQLGESGAQPTDIGRPVKGGPFYKLADFLSSFVPGLGQLQLVDFLVSLLDGNDDKASWYLQHPAEALRDLLT